MLQNKKNYINNCHIVLKISFIHQKTETFRIWLVLKYTGSNKRYKISKNLHIAYILRQNIIKRSGRVSNASVIK